MKKITSPQFDPTNPYATTGLKHLKEDFKTMQFENFISSLFKVDFPVAQIKQRRMREWKGCGWQRSWSDLGYYYRICLEELRITTTFRDFYRLRLKLTMQDK